MVDTAVNWTIYDVKSVFQNWVEYKFPWVKQSEYDDLLRRYNNLLTDYNNVSRRIWIFSPAYYTLSNVYYDKTNLLYDKWFLWDWFSWDTYYTTAFYAHDTNSWSSWYPVICWMKKSKWANAQFISADGSSISWFVNKTWGNQFETVTLNKPEWICVYVLFDILHYSSNKYDYREWRSFWINVTTWASLWQSLIWTNSAETVPFSIKYDWRNQIWYYSYSTIWKSYIITNITKSWSSNNYSFTFRF